MSQTIQRSLFLLFEDNVFIWTWREKLLVTFEDLLGIFWYCTTTGSHNAEETTAMLSIPVRHLCKRSKRVKISQVVHENVGGFSNYSLSLMTVLTLSWQKGCFSEVYYVIDAVWHYGGIWKQKLFLVNKNSLCWGVLRPHRMRNEHIFMKFSAVDRIEQDLENTFNPPLFSWDNTFTLYGQSRNIILGEFISVSEFENHHKDKLCYTSPFLERK